MSEDQGYSGNALNCLKKYNAKVTMRHFEDAIKKVREQKDLKISQKVELSAFR